MTIRTGPPRADEFDGMYEGTPAWEIGRPQPALAALADGWRGAVLDVGCGTGEHALQAASRGLAATGVDVSPRAIAWAERKARERGLAARFVVGNALELGWLEQRFEVVIDSALFHVFDDDERPRFTAALAAATEPGGRCYLLCFSDEEPGTWGPRRVSQAELRAAFAGPWRIEAIEAATLEISAGAGRAAAWRMIATRS